MRELAAYFQKITYLEWPVRKAILNIDLLQIINHCSLMVRITISSSPLVANLKT